MFLERFTVGRTAWARFIKSRLAGRRTASKLRRRQVRGASGAWLALDFPLQAIRDPGPIGRDGFRSWLPVLAPSGGEAFQQAIGVGEAWPVAAGLHFGHERGLSFGKVPQAAVKEPHMTGAEPIFDGIARVIGLLAAIDCRADERKDSRQFPIFGDQMWPGQFSWGNAVDACHERPLG